MAVVKNLMVRAGADFSGMRKEMQKAKKDISSFQTKANFSGLRKEIAKTEKQMGTFRSNMSGYVKGIAAAIASIGIGAGIKSAVNDAMQYEASIMQINRTMGTSAQAFRDWAKDNASAFGMSKLEVMKYGAVYSNLLSSFSKGTAETTERTKELLQASAVVAAATGRTMDDTMERIRSGLLGNTEAIEDLGINVNVAMIESTNAFKQFANGKHWEQLNFQTQQQIRLMAILEQAQQKYGDQIANNTISRQQQLVAQLKNVRLALGQAFLPIYNAILPALIRFATALATVMNFIAQFTTALFGGSVKSQQAQTKATTTQTAAVGGLGDAYKDAGDKAKKAGKKAKGAAASFDQLNLIGGKDSSGGADNKAPDASGGAVAPIPTDGLFSNMNDGMIDVSSKAKAMADAVRAAFETAFKSIKDVWDFVVSSLSPSFQKAWGEIQPVLANWKTLFQKMFSDIMTLGVPLASWFQTKLIPLWQQGVELGGHIIAGLGDSIKNVVSTIWEFAFPILSKFVTDGLPRLTDFLMGAQEIFGKLFDLVKQIFDDLWTGAADPALKQLSQIVQDYLDIIFKKWDEWGKKIQDNIKTALDKIKELWTNLFNVTLKPFIDNMLENLKWLWDKHLKGVVDEVTTFVGKLTTGATDIFNKFIMPIANWLTKTLGPTFSNIFSLVGDVIGTVVGVISDAAKGIMKSLGGIVDFVSGVFTGDWKKAWNGIKTFFEGIGDSLAGIFKGAVNLIIDALNFMIRQLNRIKIDIPDWVSDVTGVGDSFGFNIPTIPKLAKGGLAYGPTLAMVGDNKGAASDPEVIAPLSKLEGIIGGNNDQQQVVSVLNSILRAVQSGQNVNVTISQKSVAEAAINGIKDHQRRTGALPFPV
ncbi:hypothetical protein ACFQ3W_11200 [Paenibacillus puldeungensis]|uniref:Phage-related protein n=1 Tax=Paenibacillus puldeungensis TaxID=696536 RepID=A0ABW3RXW8_9BACL